MVEKILFLFKRGAKMRRMREHAGHGNLRTNHSIDDEFNSGDFF